MEIIVVALSILLSRLLFLFLFEKRNKKSIDVGKAVAYNGMAYWFDGENLYRSPFINDSFDVDRAVLVNQMTDLMPVEIVEIISALKEKE